MVIARCVYPYLPEPPDHFLHSGPLFTSPWCARTSTDLYDLYRLSFQASFSRVYTIAACPDRRHDAHMSRKVPQDSDGVGGC